MAALGRILQVLGWLWLAFGLFGPDHPLLDLGVPFGIIVIFVARVIRNQAATSDLPELGDRSGDGSAPAEQEREKRPEPRARPEPRTRPESRARPEPRPEPPEPAYSIHEPESEPEVEERSELLEQIVGAGREIDEEMSGPMGSDDSETEESRRPMSSAEMIARAHERWDSKR